MTFILLNGVSFVAFVVLLIFYVTEVGFIHPLSRKMSGNVLFALWLILSSVAVFSIPITIELHSIGYLWSIPMYLIVYKLIKISFAKIFKFVHGITTHDFCLASADATEADSGVEQ